MEPRRSRNQLRSLTTSIADLRAIPSDQDCVEICGLPTQNVSVHHCDSPSTSLNGLSVLGEGTGPMTLVLDEGWDEG
ncbi:hypothetical protein V6N11_060773 [Hibiscus sabdariffa]|uniref:Uncharacterized protein n=1 Tax=Hibiscus sabdariffa TaxID=183260 RepID=A0ABR2QRB8_9ROSI